MTRMATRRAYFPTARALAAALWVLQRSGYVTRVGLLENGSTSEGDVSENLHTEAVLWASRLGVSQATGLVPLEIDARELADLPTLQTYLLDHRSELTSWLDDVCPQNEGRHSLPILMRNLKTLGRRRGYDPASETFLVVPGQEARGFRIGPTEYVLTRELTNAQDLFAEWAAQRHTMPTETISSVLGVTARR